MTCGFWVPYRSSYLAYRKLKIIWSWRGAGYNICSFRSQFRAGWCGRRKKYEFGFSIKTPAGWGNSASAFGRYLWITLVVISQR